MADHIDADHDHALAAKEFATALLGITEARNRLEFLAQEDVAEESFERPVELYERACGRLIRAKEALDEAKSADPRPLCEACLERLYTDQLKNTCSAAGYRRSHVIKEKP